jgi:DnaK suppressor protein
MQQTEVETYKQRLEIMVEAVKPAIGRRVEICIDDSPDQFDQMESAREREIAIQILENDSGRLRCLLAALRRIQEGTYGTCIRCDGEIGVKRLNALPWAAYCLECQSIVDEDSKDVTERPPIRFTSRSNEIE